MFLWNILLAITWTALTGELSWANLLLGLFFGYIILIFAAQRGLTDRPTYVWRVWRTLTFLLFFLSELVKSNLRITAEVLTPTHYLKPGVIALPLEASAPLEITLLSNIITLTPGTLGLEVSQDRKILYVHSMYIDINDLEGTKRELKEKFERPLLEVLR